MRNRGSFGYKIGRKTRLMKVQYDADMLWQTCVREIYVLMKHFGSVDLLKEAFENLKDAKNKPSDEAIEKCLPYTDFTTYTDFTKTNEYKDKDNDDWYTLTRNCQHSYINILDSGYFLNNGEKLGLIFLLDLNTNSVRFYSVDHNKNEKEIDSATIDEIMEFDDMPTKTYTEIIEDTRERAQQFYDKLKKEEDRIEHLRYTMEKTIEMGATHDVIQKATDILRKVEGEYQQMKEEYCYFYHRLIHLNLIEDL